MIRILRVPPERSIDCYPHPVVGIVAPMNSGQDLSLDSTQTEAHFWNLRFSFDPMLV